MSNPFEGTEDAYAEPPAPAGPAPAAAVADPLARLVTLVCEDAIFSLSAALGNNGEALEGLVQRRASAHAACMQNTRIPTMTGAFDHWVVDMTRAITPLCPPSWLPMAEVLREKVTLEIGARGLRGLFTSKPSEKEIARVRKYGTLATRVLRTVFAADGPVDTEEARTIAAFITSLGLPDADTAPLYNEAPVAIEQLELYGEVEPGVARAMMRGAWLAAAWDSIDPREEVVLRALGQKLTLSIEDFEMMRTEAIARVDARRAAGLASIEAVRFVLSDRAPGVGVPLAAYVGTLMLPRRYREEALAHVGHGTPVTLAGRYRGISAEEKISALGMAWACGLHEDPPVGRIAVLAARLERFAKDLDIDPKRARSVVDGALDAALAAVTANMV
jgi:tellurite resistance protein